MEVKAVWGYEVHDLLLASCLAVIAVTWPTVCRLYKVYTVQGRALLSKMRA